MKHEVILSSLEAFERSKNIISLFEFYATNSPSSIAIELENEKVTYKELQEFSYSIAERIQQQDVNSSSVVAVCMDKSIELIASFIAILQCGLTFLPLDTNNPKSYNQLLVAKANADLVLTQIDTELDDVPVIAIKGASDHKISGVSKFNIKKPTLAAYCCFTSGTTGVPKGILIGHESIHNLILDWINKDVLSDVEKFSFWTAQTFDVSIWEWLLPLSLGAMVCIVPQDVRVDPKAFLHWLKKNEITSSYIPPFIVRLLPELSDYTDYFPKTILIGVEPFVESKMASVFPKSTRVINGYGPTEATVYATTYSSELENNDRNIPIGKPILNSEALLLDNNLELVEGEGVGQVAISGPNLAIGYINADALTEEKFVNNPYSESYSRMYLTGDVARRLPSGDFEFVGRVDEQVKVRGYRVELNHVKFTIEQIPYINEAQILLAEDNMGSNYLAAFYTLSAKGKHLFELDVLKRSLAKKLPEYMLPSKWQELKEMPLTASGKIDKNKLHIGDDEREGEQKLDESSTSSLVTSVWLKVLGSRVDEDSAFSALGGTSIQKVSIKFQISKLLKQPTELPDIKDHSLKQYIYEVLLMELEDAGSDIKSCCKVEQVSKDKVSLTAVQSQILFNELLREGAKAYYFHAAFQLSGFVEIDLLKGAITKLVSRYEVLRSTVQHEGALYFFKESLYEPHIKRYDFNCAYVGFEEFSQSSELKLCLSEKFDIENNPLIRWCIFTFNDGNVVLVQSEHHLIHDGMSFRILANELASLYSGSDKKIGSDDYLNHCMFDLEYRKSETYLHMVTSYSNKLSSRLKTVSPIFHNTTNISNGSQIRQFIPNALSKSLEATSNREGISLYILMLGAMGITLKQYFSKEEFFVGAALHNRSSFFDTIGMFVNTLPLYFNLSENGEVKQLLASLNDELNYSSEYSNVILSDVYQTLKLSKIYKGRPIYDVAFSFHDSLDFSNDFKNASCDLVEGLADGTTKFPLNVVVIKGNTASQGGLELVVEFDNGLLSEINAREITSSFLTMLSNISLLGSFDRVQVRDLGSCAKYQQELEVSQLLTDSSNEAHSVPLLNRTVLERVRLITQELLGRTEISDEQDLFEIGLHSLVMIKMTTSFNNEFKIDLKLRKLYKLTTLSSLSEYIQAELASKEAKND